MLSRDYVSFIDDTLAAFGSPGREIWRFAMSASWLRVLGFTIASSWLAVGCSSSSEKGDSSSTTGMSVGGPCVLNGDCNDSLVCTWGKCHTPCMFLSNCLVGQSCVNVSSNTSDAGDAGAAGDAADAGPKTTAVCQLPVEADCAQTMTCGGGFVCASDLRCRSACQSFSDCSFGQLCAGGVCADPSDLANGQLPQKKPSSTGDAGADVPQADAGRAGDRAAGDSPSPIDASSVETANDSAASADIDAGEVEVL